MAARGLAPVPPTSPDGGDIAGYAFRNFVKIHQTLKVTPAMPAGVTDRLWEIEDLVGLL